MKARKRAQLAELMARMHAVCPPGIEVHHIFGRVGRLAACRRFCCYLTVPKGGANHHDHHPSILKGLRDGHREERQKMIEANEHNRDVTTCWWTECIHHKYRTCELAENPPA